MGCSGSKFKCMIFGGQIDGNRMEMSYSLAELRSHGLVDPSSLTVDGSASRRKLKYVVSKNPDFSSVVTNFLNHVIIMSLRSLTATKQGIKKVRTDLETVGEKAMKNNKKKKNRRKQKYMDVMAKRRELRAEGEQLAVARFNTEEQRLACEQQLVLLEKLSRRKHKLQKSLRWAKMWRKAWNAIYKILYIVVCAGSVALGALACPPAATVAATVASNGIKSVEPWFNSLWDEHESTLKAQMEVVAAMEKGGFLVHELLSILSLMEMVDIDLGAMPGKEEEVVEAVEMFGIGNIKNKIGAIKESIDGLDENVDWCISEIRKLATDFLKILTEEII